MLDMEHGAGGGKPHIAVVGRNMLCNLGLSFLLKDIMPVAQIDLFSSVEAMQASSFSFFHYFVTLQALISQPVFFEENKRRTIVLHFDSERNLIPENFRTLSLEQSEVEMTRSIAQLQQTGHRGDKHLPVEVKNEIESHRRKDVLTPREKDVLRLIVTGHINKEIADILNIALTTVISHRKNIIAKLRIRSVSELTLYAVLHGYIMTNEI